MPCPVCNKLIDTDADHRRCFFKLLETNVVKNVDEWVALSTKPVTIKKGRVRALIPKE
jgi:hypothetical protein